MITRIVKLTFDPNFVSDFKAMYAEVHPHIEGFEGCHQVELKQDSRYSNVLFTVSQWEDESNLQAYRKSALFAQTWAKTKTWFCGNPQAWTLLNP